MLAAVVQMSSWMDLEKNLNAAQSLIDQATAGGAGFVVLPELFTSYGDLAAAASFAEPITGPLVAKFREWAAAHNIWLCPGTFVERDGEHVYNTSLLIDPAGQIAARYRKRHLFNIDLTEQVVASEGDVFTRGDDLACVTTTFGTLGWGICFDLRFPEQFRRLARMGTEIFVVPSAFTQTTGRDHWELLLRARAVENLCYVVAADQVGKHSASMTSFGGSCIVDPWGKVVARVAEDGPGIAFAELDLGKVHELRRRLPVHRLRRE